MTKEVRAEMKSATYVQFNDSKQLIYHDGGNK